MARIRSIHPEACDSEKLAALSDSAERTFFRLLTHTDDEGRAEDRPKLLAAKLYPLHDGKGADTVDADLSEIETVGLLVRYSVDGRCYLAIPTFGDWQKPRHPTPSKLPAPEDDDSSGEDDDGSSTEDSVSLTAERGNATETVRPGEGVGEGVEMEVEGEHADADASRNGHGPEPSGVDAINGNDGIPREPEPGMTYAQTLAAWLEGKDRWISPRDKVSDEYRALLDTTCEFIGDRTHLTATVAEKLVRDLSIRLTDEDLPDSELSMLRKALRNRKPVGGVLSVVATAMENDAGKGEYANKPGALMRYALACLDGRGSRKAAS